MARRTGRYDHSTSRQAAAAIAAARRAAAQAKYEADTDFLYNAMLRVEPDGLSIDEFALDYMEQHPEQSETEAGENVLEVGRRVAALKSRLRSLMDDLRYQEPGDTRPGVRPLLDEKGKQVKRPSPLTGHLQGVYTCEMMDDAGPAEQVKICPACGQRMLDQQEEL
jgi:hypothetical protein